MENREQTEKLLDTLANVSNINPEIRDAKAYGVNRDKDGELVSQLIDFNPDIYELIYNLKDSDNFNGYEYITFLTTGWAAPLNSSGEVDGVPSQHPDRRRVALTIAVSVAKTNIIGSVLKFDDSEAETVYDLNEATGALAEAITELF